MLSTMSKSCLFSYGISLHDSGHVSVSPVAQVGIENRHKEWNTFVLLIDSGATTSAFPISDAKLLGVDVEQGEKLVVMGVGGVPLRGWSHKIRIALGENKFMIPLIFIDDPQAPRVLGRAGIFEKFLVVFEESKRRAGLIGKRDTKAKIIRKVLDGLRR